MLNQGAQYKSLKDIIELSRAFWKSKILLVANELDVFSKLSDSSKTSKDLSKILKMDTRATELLLNALAAMGFFKKENGYFSNTEVSKRYLCRESREYIGFALRHYNYCWDAWSGLEEVVKRGQPTRFLEQEALRKDEKRARDFTLKMDFTGWKMAEEIEQIVDLSNVKRMLDLGGGSGCYSIYFAKKHPQLHCTIFELPFVAKIAEENVKKHNLKSRLKVIAGDFMAQDINGKYDLVLLSFIIHSFGPGEILQILQKTSDILKSSGKIVIQEYTLDDTGRSPLGATIFGILMFLSSRNGRVYNLKEIGGFLKRSGFRVIVNKRIKGKSHFIMGRNPHLIIGEK